MYNVTCDVTVMKDLSIRSRVAITVQGRRHRSLWMWYPMILDAWISNSKGCENSIVDLLKSFTTLSKLSNVRNMMITRVFLFTQNTTYLTLRNTTATTWLRPWMINVGLWLIMNFKRTLENLMMNVRRVLAADTYIYITEALAIVWVHSSGNNSNPQRLHYGLRVSGRQTMSYVVACQGNPSETFSDLRDTTWETVAVDPGYAQRAS